MARPFTYRVECEDHPYRREWRALIAGLAKSVQSCQHDDGNRVLIILECQPLNLYLLCQLCFQTGNCGLHSRYFFLRPHQLGYCPCIALCLLACKFGSDPPGFLLGKIASICLELGQLPVLIYDLLL